MGCPGNGLESGSVIFGVGVDGAGVLYWWWQFLFCIK